MTSGLTKGDREQIVYHLAKGISFTNSEHIWIVFELKKARIPNIKKSPFLLGIILTEHRVKPLKGQKKIWSLHTGEL